jgi:hypothetical protein
MGPAAVSLLLKGRKEVCSPLISTDNTSSVVIVLPITPIGPTGVPWLRIPEMSEALGVLLKLTFRVPVCEVGRCNQ